MDLHNTPVVPTSYDVEQNLFRFATAALAGREIGYVTAGAGRPVVLLHGYTDSWHSYRLVLPFLSTHARCFAIDQRGHGRSRRAGNDFSMDAFAADVVDFVIRLRLGPVTLVGHSMGSLVARKAALTCPDLVDRLVLVGAPLRVDNPGVRGMVADLAAFRNVVPRSYAEEFQAACVADRTAVPDWFFDACVDTSASMAAKTWRSVLAGILADDSADRVGQIRQPTLSIGGRDDAFFGPDEQRALVRALPRGRLLLYDGVGHCPNWERPARFAEDVSEFLAGLD